MDATATDAKSDSNSNSNNDWVWTEPGFLSGRDNLRSEDSCVYSSQGEYRDGSHWYTCRLCQELGVMKEHDFKLHCLKSDNHASRAAALCKERDELLPKYGKSRELDRVIKLLGSPPALESAIYRYVSGRITFEQASHQVQEFERANPQARFGATYG